MNITIIKNEELGVDSIVLRELYGELEIKQEYAKWSKRQLKVFLENQDFTSFDTLVKREKGSSIRKDHAITLDTAKHIALMSRAKKGKEYRDRLIKMEKKSREQPAFEIPGTLSGALLLASGQAAIVEGQKLLIAEQAPKVKVLETLSESEGAMTFTQAAKALGVGPRKLTQALVDSRVLYRSNKLLLAHQRYIERGYFEQATSERTYTVRIQTRVTAKGLTWLAKNFNND